MKKLKIRLTDVLPIKSTICIRQRLDERIQADRRKIKKDNDKEIGAIIMKKYQDNRGWQFMVRGMLDGNFCGFYNKMTSKSGGGWHRIKAMQPRATADEAQVDLDKRAIEKKWQKVDD